MVSASLYNLLYMYMVDFLYETIIRESCCVFYGVGWYALLRKRLTLHKYFFDDLCVKWKVGSSMYISFDGYALRMKGNECIGSIKKNYFPFSGECGGCWSLSTLGNISKASLIITSRFPQNFID